MDNIIIKDIYNDVVIPEELNEYLTYRSCEVKDMYYDVYFNCVFPPREHVFIYPIDLIDDLLECVKGNIDDYEYFIQALKHNILKHFKNIDDYLQSRDVYEYIGKQSDYLNKTFTTSTDETVLYRWVYDKFMLMTYEIYNEVLKEIDRWNNK